MPFILRETIMGTFLPASTSPLLTTRFVNVLHWAAELHNRQVRETYDIPYVSHLLTVAALTLEQGAILLPAELLEDAAIVALMHHSVTDIGLPLELFESIGSNVQAAMQLLCQDCPYAKPGQRQSYVQRLINGRGEAAAIAQLVAAADHLDNLRFYVEQGRSLWQPGDQRFYEHFLEQVNVPSVWANEMDVLLKRLYQPVRSKSGAGAI
jgi:(p)ppGpp synthase/HD superfamily hydrolase